MSLPFLPRPLAALAPSMESSSSGEGDMSDVIIWLVVLMIIVAIGGFIIVAARRKLSDDPAGGAPSFSLASLRAMHTKGELTDEEFKKACEHLRKDVSGAPPRSD